MNKSRRKAADIHGNIADKTLTRTKADQGAVRQRLIETNADKL